VGGVSKALGKKGGGGRKEGRRRRGEEGCSPDMGSTPVVFSKAREAKSGTSKQRKGISFGRMEQRKKEGRRGNASKLTSNVRIRIPCQLLQRGHNLPSSDLLSFRRRREGDGENLESLSDVEPDVGDGIVDESESGVENGISDGCDVENGSHGLFER